MADEGDEQSGGSWTIPGSTPPEGAAGWDDDGSGAPGKGGQWVQPPRPGIRPPAAPPAPPPSATLAPPLPRPATPALPGGWSPTPFPAPARPAAAAPAEPPAVAVAPAWLADVGAGLAFAIDIGVLLQFVGSILSGWSNHAFVGSTLVSEVDHSGRVRILEVFSAASFEHAVIVVVALLLTVSVVTERPSALRRPALVLGAFLGVYIAAGAALRATALITFLGTSAALAVGSTLIDLAAVPVACGAVIWAAVLLAGDERARRAAAAGP